VLMCTSAWSPRESTESHLPEPGSLSKVLTQHNIHLRK
jgi:hypothetical protein